MNGSQSPPAGRIKAPSHRGRHTKVVLRSQSLMKNTPRWLAGNPSASPNTMPVPEPSNSGPLTGADGACASVPQCALQGWFQPKWARAKGMNTRSPVVWSLSVPSQFIPPSKAMSQGFREPRDTISR